MVVAAEVDQAAGLAQRVARSLAEEAAAAAARHFLPPLQTPFKYPRGKRVRLRPRAPDN